MELNQEMKVEFIENKQFLDKLYDKVGKRKAILSIVFFAWFPLVLMSWLEGHGPYLDAAANVRLLISLPLFLGYYSLLIHKLNWALNYFKESQIIKDKDWHNILRVIERTERFENSRWLKVVLIALAILLGSIGLFSKDPSAITLWRAHGGASSMWYYIVARPLYYFAVFSFLSLILIWWRLIFCVSRLDLTIRPAHGDGVGGLGFLSDIINSFIIPVFAFSCAAAGTLATLVINNKLSLPGLKISLIGYVVILTGMMIGPMLLFFPVLLKSRPRAMHDYGILSSRQMRVFDERWVSGPMIQESLSVPDFSSMSNLGSDVKRVHSLRILPIKLTDLITFSVTIGIPFIPVFALEMPWKDVFKGILTFFR